MLDVNYNYPEKISTLEDRIEQFSAQIETLKFFVEQLRELEIVGFSNSPQEINTKIAELAEVQEVYLTRFISQFEDLRNYILGGAQ